MKPFLVRSLLVALLVASSAVGMAASAPRRILVVTVTTGFRHASIATAERVLAQLAAESGEFQLDFVRQPDGEPKAPKRQPVSGSEPDSGASAAEEKAYQATREVWLGKVAGALQPLRPDNLARYDAVLFASTTGDLPLPDKAGFLKWIADGHAFIGIHAASDTFHGYADFIAMLGGEFSTHGPQVGVECLNEDPQHAATKMLPANWPVFDEIYQFKNFDRKTVHGLLGMDKHPNEKTPGYFPVAWCKRYGTGRVFYTSLGHRDDVWDPAATEKDGRRNPPELARLYQQHLLGGIRWALGLAPGDAEPQPVTSTRPE